MKIGYGRDRKEKDFTKHGVDKFEVFIDTDASDRAERNKCLQYIAGHLESFPDDPVTLVLYSMGEFGQGADLVFAKGEIERMSVNVELVTTKGPKKPPGRPAGSADFAPTPEHDAEIRAAYHDRDRSPTGILNIAKRAGYDVTMSQLKYRYGNRFK